MTTSALTRAGERLYRMPVLLLVLCAIFWAGNTVAARLAIGEIDPFMLTALRWIAVAAVLWPIYGGEIRAHWGEIRPRLPWIALLAILGMTGFNALYYVAAHYTSAINIGILQGSMPIFVLAGAYLAHGTRASLIQWAGVLITALGVVVVATRGAPLAILEVELNKGDLAMLAACGLYALYTVALRDRPAMPGNAFFALLAIIAAVTSLPLVALEAYMSGFKLPTVTGLLVTAVGGDLPLVPVADLLPARRRPDRAGARGRVRQPGAGVRGRDGRDADLRAVRAVPRRRPGAGDRRHLARPAHGQASCTAPASRCLGRSGAIGLRTQDLLEAARVERPGLRVDEARRRACRRGPRAAARRRSCPCWRAPPW